MKIILGDITYPKSDCIIIPANMQGIMNNGIARRVIKEGFNSIKRESKKEVKENNYNIGDCFITGPGKLKRRGVKKIYHTIIKSLPNDYTSLDIVEKSLLNCLRQIINDKVKSVSICGLGIDDGDLDKRSVARIMFNICNMFDNKIDIKIVDDNEEFIEELENFSGIK
jgi:O-acetyl-ADP-ribose deacetylase (regulator of RNase III)